MRDCVDERLWRGDPPQPCVNGGYMTRSMSIYFSCTTDPQPFCPFFLFFIYFLGEVLE
jgi:hypothetical protein